jgi:5-methyltetrahydropteroyltriglutamate--homocysteine methyltransferase
VTRPLPLLPTTSVGSLPKPDSLRRLRTRAARGDVAPEVVDEAVREATRQSIRMQEELGLDLLVHGEMERGDMVAYFAEAWDGFESSGFVRSYGNRYYRKPVARRPLSARGAVTVDMWRFAQSLTDRPVKGMLTGPYTIMDWSFNEAYPDRRAFALALADLVHDEAAALEAAGARYIQIDEPALSTRPEEIELAIEAMARVTRGLTAKTISHMCYGDWQAVYPRFLDLPVDQLDLEAANNDFAILDLLRRGPVRPEVALGVVDVHSHRVESAEEVEAAILRALEFLPADRLYIDPDCGLKTRTEDEAHEKLQAVVEGTRRVRERLGAR